MKQKIKENKGFIPLLVIIIVLAVVVVSTGTGVTLYKQNKLPFLSKTDQSKPEIKEQIPTETPVLVVEPAIEPIASPVPSDMKKSPSPTAVFKSTIIPSPIPTSRLTAEPKPTLTPTPVISDTMIAICKIEAKSEKDSFLAARKASFEDLREKTIIQKFPDNSYKNYLECTSEAEVRIGGYEVLSPLEKLKLISQNQNVCLLVLQADKMAVEANREAYRKQLYKALDINKIYGAEAERIYQTTLDNCLSK